MEIKEIEAKIKEFLVEEFEVAEDKISPGANLKKDLGIDSLDIVDIIVMVDDVFGIKLKSEDFKQLITVSDFVNFIDQKLR